MEEGLERPDPPRTSTGPGGPQRATTSPPQCLTEDFIFLEKTDFLTWVLMRPWLDQGPGDQ